MHFSRAVMTICHTACLTLCFSLTTVASAQSDGDSVSKSELLSRAIARPIVAEVVPLFELEDRRAQAWAGYLVGQHRLLDAVPALIECVASERVRKGSVQHLVLLDALLRCDAQLTPQQAADCLKFDGLCFEPSVALISRDPERHAAQLRRLYSRIDKRLYSTAWIAAGQRLADVKDREWATGLWARLQHTIHVTVLTPEQETGPIHIGGGVGGRFGGRSRIAVPDGFPPVADYRLVRVPEAGDVVLTAGHTPVWLRRVVHHGRSISRSVGAPYNRIGRCELAWLTQMGGAAAAELGIGLDSYSTLRLGEDTVVEFRAELGALVEKHRGRMATFRAALEAAGVLSAASEAEPDGKPDGEPAVVVELDDQRPEPRSELPADLPGVGR